ncbi:hypothetical protein VNI00_011222 [Paramarasmius palmivorus]|uniref:DUF6534 domain-containing protein n=1 Tax=Paramarasmius palmivorus TaxID=297713 RepID=A0AAW0CE32_9AGAR
MSPSSTALPETYGALLLGSLFASALSGAVVIQVILYFKLYSSDAFRLKLLVFLIWLLDTCHTSLIWSALWAYFVGYYGQVEKIDYIPRTLALSVIFTAILTFCVHCFFALRLFRLSHGNWLLTGPILILALLRLGTAAASTTEMFVLCGTAPMPYDITQWFPFRLILRSFSQFVERDGWIFTVGLSSSSAVDVLITASLFFLLRNSRRTTSGKTSLVIDSLIIHTFETASLTSASTIVCMICWVAMPSNLIFMGLHFFIGKLYALSLLVTLNIKSEIRDKFHHSTNRSGSGIVFSGGRSSRPGGFMMSTTKVEHYEPQGDFDGGKGMSKT